MNNRAVTFFIAIFDILLAFLLKTPILFQLKNLPFQIKFYLNYFLIIVYRNSSPIYENDQIFTLNLLQICVIFVFLLKRMLAISQLILIFNFILIKQ